MRRGRGRVVVVDGGELGRGGGGGGGGRGRGRRRRRHHGGLEQRGGERVVLEGGGRGGEPAGGGAAVRPDQARRGRWEGGPAAGVVVAVRHGMGGRGIRSSTFADWVFELLSFVACGMNGTGAE